MGAVTSLYKLTTTLQPDLLVFVWLSKPYVYFQKSCLKYTVFYSFLAAKEVGCSGPALQLVQQPYQRGVQVERPHKYWILWEISCPSRKPPLTFGYTTQIVDHARYQCMIYCGMQ